MKLAPALRPLWPVAKRAYTAGTVAASYATERLSRARDGQLPARSVATVDALVGTEEGVRVLPVRTAEVITRAVPSVVDRRNPTFETQARIPRRVIAVLPRGRVLGPERAVISGEGTLIQELSEYFGTSRPREQPLYLRPFPGPPHEVAGSLGMLASRADVNYYHFMTDVLPRLGLLEQCLEQHPDAPHPQRWYVPRSRPFQRELLAMVGVPTDAVVDSDEHPHVRAEELIVPSIPDLHLRTPPWLVEFLRGRLRPADVEVVPGRRIYVTRGQQRNTRIVRNEAEVVAALGRFGFAVVDPAELGVAEQIRAFAEAETIVGPHGANLTNIAFASPGATLVEIFPPAYVQGCYWKLADGVPGLAYRAVIGRGRTRRPDRPFSVASDIVVDVPGLVEVVAAAVGSGRRAGRDGVSA